MARAKGGFKTRRRRNRMRQEASGYRGGRSRLWKVMVETVHHAWVYATRDRKNKKRNYRTLWIVRIGAAAKQLGVRYSELMGALARNNIQLDRKTLADLAVHDMNGFAKLVEQVGLLPAKK